MDVISFNAWEYSASEVIWPGLVRKVMEALEPRGRLQRYARRLRRNLWRQTRLLLPQIIIGATVIAVTFLIAVAASGFSTTVLVGVVAALGVGGVVKLVGDAVTNPLGRWFSLLFEDRRYGNPIGYMEDIKDDLDDLQKTLKRNNGRILIVIDDLDRCEPEKAVEVLQAINLLLNFESFIVCLGIDARVITRAVERHYQDILREAGASGYEYLDKIVQIPFRIPEPNDDAITGFLLEQMGNPKPANGGSGDQGPSRPASDRPEASAPRRQGPSQSETGGGGSSSALGASASSSAQERLPVAFEYAEYEAFQAMTPYLRPNPRHIKRLVHVYRLVRSLAALKGDALVSENPRETIRWLMVAGQWPYTANSMLREFSGMLDEWRDEIPDTAPSGDPLRHLLEAVTPTLSVDRQRTLDDDPQLLRDLVEADDDGALSWEQLRALRAYTVNFNPAVEEHAAAPVTAPAV